MVEFVRTLAYARGSVIRQAEIPWQLRPSFARCHAPSRKKLSKTIVCVSQDLSDRYYGNFSFRDKVTGERHHQARGDARAATSILGLVDVRCPIYSREKV